MIKQYLLITIIGVVSGAHTAVMAATDPFLESGGRLIFETESEQPSSSDWSVESAIYGQTGQSYLVWRGQNFLGAPNGESTISYPVRITTPGNYQLQWRSRNTVGLDATEHNDGWVRFPTGVNIEGEHPLEKGENGDRWTKAYMGQVEQWTWDTYTVDGNNQLIRQYLEAGDHVIEIAGRSTGHAVDRIGLYLYEEQAFDTQLFETLNQSPRLSESSETHHVYTGNICAAQELTLAAGIALQVTGTGTLQPDDVITVNDSGTKALLQFTLPETTTSEAADASANLVLSGLNSLTGLSIYLGSHNNWNAQTAADDLPHSSVLLGELTGNAQNNRHTLSIERSMFAENKVTLVLESENNGVYQLFGIGEGAEPRLDFTLTADACNTYQSARANTPFLGGEESETETGTETGTDTGTETGTDTGTETGTDTGTDTETETGTDTGTETSTETSTDTETETETGTETETESETNTDSGNTNESTDDTGEEDTSSTSGSSGGGAFSTLLLGVLALFGFYRRR